MAESRPQLHPQFEKGQLGKYAQEAQMPAWLYSLLEKSPGTITDGIIPALEQLLQRSQLTKYAYLCHHSTQHISKLRKEGAFCGYRNIQTLVSYIQGAHVKGSEHFGEGIPDIFQLQDMIEDAWDKGFNPRGRIETGGIRGTRKYIGTPEAQALFRSLGFQCSVSAFREKADPGLAFHLLLDCVERYFEQSGMFNSGRKLRKTELPPIYLQRSGHSVTIIGIERQMDDRRCLLVLDPAFRGSTVVKKCLKKIFTFEILMNDKLLRPYRRTARDLRKFSEFEIL